MADFVYREALSFDFSNAPIYRKTATLDKSKVEVATKTQEVTTIIDGKVETTNTANAGDRIITGPKNERYVIRQEKFGGLYEEDPGNPSRYISKQIIRVVPLTEDTEITPPWGGTQRAAKGSVAAQSVSNPKDIYLIDEGAFKATYAQESAGRPAAPALRVEGPKRGNG